MSHLLPRFSAVSQRIEDERKIGQIMIDSALADVPLTVARATLPGDMRRLRGIPVCAMGVGGTSPGTDPLGAALRLVL